MKDYELIDEDPIIIAYENGPRKETYTEFGVKACDEIRNELTPILDRLIEKGLSTRDIQSLVIEATFDYVLKIRLET